MAALELFLFGNPRLKRADQTLDVGLRKAMAIIVYLAVTGQPQNRDALATLLWPDRDGSDARARLRRTLHRLRQSLAQLDAEDLLVSAGDAISLSDTGLCVDTMRFRDLVEKNLPENWTGERLDAVRTGALEDAVRMYTDDFLAGFTLRDCPAFDEWQFFQAESLRQTLRRALIALSRSLAVNREYDRAIEHARRWLALDACHEPAHRALMQLYATSDQQAAALRQFSECQRILAQELGVKPQAETTRLYEAIRSGKPAPPERPEVRYVESDGVHIAWAELGEGPTDMLFVPGYVSHLEEMWEWESYAAFNRRLASFSRLIMFDKRGVGLSERISEGPSEDGTLKDMSAVLDAAGSERVVLFGVSEGGPISVRFALEHPDRVRALILYGTFTKGTRSDDFPWALPREQYDKWLDYLVAQWGGPSNVEFCGPSVVENQAFRAWWARALRMASTPQGMRAVLETIRDVDVRPWLPEVAVPTLVVHRKDDMAVRVGQGRYLAEHIAGAEYVELEGQDHWWWVGDSEPILRAIEDFVSRLD